MRGPLLLGAGAAAATAALHLRDPHAQGSWGICPFYALTGAYCPGCGGLRAVNDLTNGDLVAAASSNLLLVLAAPVVMLLWVLWVRTRWRGDQAPPRGHPVAVSLVVGAVLVAFTLVRNLSFGSWLAP